MEKSGEHERKRIEVWLEEEWLKPLPCPNRPLTLKPLLYPFLISFFFLFGNRNFFFVYVSHFSNLFILKHISIPFSFKVETSHFLSFSK
jgi:hypothetical protein